MHPKWLDRTERLVNRTKRFVANRLSTDTYIGLHLTVTFLVAVAAIWLSSALLEAVLDNAALVRWDVAAAEWVHARVTPRGISLPRGSEPREPLPMQGPVSGTRGPDSLSASRF